LSEQLRTLTPIATDIEEISPLVVRLHPSIEMDSDRFFDFCQFNRDLRIERTATGEKMQEYIDNGVLLGFLLDSERKQVYIYRSNREVERLDNPETLSGEPVLKGFTLELKQIW
jgi:Putative restriction endonuclease